MEGTLHLKSVTGDWFSTRLVLDSACEMSWTKQDGKSCGQYNVQAPVETKEKMGQARKFCFEVLHPVTKKSFIFSAANEEEQRSWISAFGVAAASTPAAMIETPRSAPKAVVVPIEKPVVVFATRPSASSSTSSAMDDKPPPHGGGVFSRTTASSSVVDDVKVVVSRPSASSSVSLDNGDLPVTMTRKTTLSQSTTPSPLSGSHCVVCNKPVYKMEEVIIDRMMMHKQCFQCEHCKRQLNMGNFACINGSMFYCKPHYFEVFGANGGKYEKAFGDAGFEKKALSSYTPGGD